MLVTVEAQWREDCGPERGPLVHSSFFGRSAKNQVDQRRYLHYVSSLLLPFEVRDYICHYDGFDYDKFLDFHLQFRFRQNGRKRDVYEFLYCSFNKADCEAYNEQNPPTPDVQSTEVIVKEDLNELRNEIQEVKNLSNRIKYRMSTKMDVSNVTKTVVSLRNEVRGFMNQTNRTLDDINKKMNSIWTLMTNRKRGFGNSDDSEEFRPHRQASRLHEDSNEVLPKRQRASHFDGPLETQNPLNQTPSNVVSVSNFPLLWSQWLDGGTNPTEMNSFSFSNQVENVDEQQGDEVGQQQGEQSEIYNSDDFVEVLERYESISNLKIDEDIDMRSDWNEPIEVEDGEIGQEEDEKSKYS